MELAEIIILILWKSLIYLLTIAGLLTSILADIYQIFLLFVLGFLEVI